MELSGTQKRLYDYLAERLARNGKAPSLRQTAADLGVSHTAIAQLLGQLEKKGAVERDGRYSRSLRLVTGNDRRQQGDRSRELPIIGQIAAGLPMYAQQEWDGSVVVDRRLFPGDNLFCLRVRGESMQGAGILHGDLAICEPRQYAANGEIVAVLIQGEEATVKRFFLQPDHIELRPENPGFPVMRYPFGEVLVQGKVIGVIRGSGGILATGQRVA
ncbi:repressor LexA [Desulfoprunum benzoelyticum]|uniref:LexA repressor n=1 Tax=Desulfoprunum benzoelyticum TaxID=1506996 RepID=A0A840ULH3_9BACT|nr:transcriptional repressor LexA [Desulfoprunum benzoelyticum]MBB5346465.1 repressor LexA [Desulfoprunum benzoelyticum]MBM9528537.1 repressor LexA [Desulfoprunum benzoelyticum]